MIYIALGSNIGKREEHLLKAIRAMEEAELMITKQSSVYETAPVGYTDQPSFYNMVVEVDSVLPADEVLNRLQKIELDLGRERLFKNGPRTIDLDILLYNSEDIQSKRLIVPHPRMRERAFVLAPLEEIAPELKIGGVTVQSLLASLPETDRRDVVRLQSLMNLI